MGQSFTKVSQVITSFEMTFFLSRSKFIEKVLHIISKDFLRIKKCMHRSFLSRFQKYSKAFMFKIYVDRRRYPCRFYPDKCHFWYALC